MSWLSRTLLAAVALGLLPQMAIAHPIQIGSVASAAAEEVQLYVPLATYLANHLQSEGIDQGRVVVAKSLHQMATLLREKKADLYIDSPFPVLGVSRLAGSKLLLRRWRKGVAELNTVIFARKESGIHRLEDLQGRMIALEEAVSTTGYFLPKLLLVQQRLTVTFKRDAEEPVGSGEVGYVLSGDDANTVAWVLRGRVSAGAMSEDTYLKEAKGNLDRLQIVHRSFTVPRHIVSVRADLPPKMVARIKAILLAMDQSEEGRKVLHAFEKTTKFDEIPEGALAPLLQAEKFIDAELARQ